MNGSVHQIYVGDSTVPWSSFTQTADTKDVVLIENGIEHLVGYTTEEVLEVQVENEACWQRTQILKTDSIGNMHGVSTILKSTFEPLSYVSLSGDDKIDVKYHGNCVTVTKNSNTTDCILENPLFDSHSVEIILRVLPLTVGYTAQLTAFHPRTQAAIPIQIQVINNAKASKGNGITCDAWKVEVHFDTRVQWYWISTSDRHLLQQSSNVGPNIVLEFRRR